MKKYYQEGLETGSLFLYKIQKGNEGYERSKDFQ